MFLSIPFRTFSYKGWVILPKNFCGWDLHGRAGKDGTIISPFAVMELKSQ